MRISVAQFRRVDNIEDPEYLRSEVESCLATLRDYEAQHPSGNGVSRVRHDTTELLMLRLKLGERLAAYVKGEQVIWESVRGMKIVDYIAERVGMSVSAVNRHIRFFRKATVVSVSELGEKGAPWRVACSPLRRRQFLDSFGRMRVGHIY